MSRFRLNVLLLFVCAFVLVFSSYGQLPTIRPEAPVGHGVVVLKAARLVDGTGKAEIANGVVVVTDDRITAVGSGSQVQIPTGAKVIDLGDVTLLPGFIDAH